MVPFGYEPTAPIDSRKVQLSKGTEETMPGSRRDTLRGAITGAGLGLSWPLVFSTALVRPLTRATRELNAGPAVPCRVTGGKGSMSPKGGIKRSDGEDVDGAS